MQQATDGQAKVQVPPYVPYKTFRNWLDDHKQGLPNRIDKSLMPTMSGAMISAMMGSLRYLGLIQEHGVTTDRLRELAYSEGNERQRVLRETLQESYGFLYSDDFDLANATGQAFSERFKQVASGDTARKCEAFFLAAAKDAELPVSKFITVRGARKGNGGRQKQRRTVSGGNPPIRNSQPKPDSEVNPPAPTPPVPTAGNTTTITFGGGETLTLTLIGDLFKLSRIEREFALSMVDRFQEFQEAAHARQQASPGESSPTAERQTAGSST